MGVFPPEDNSNGLNASFAPDSSSGGLMPPSSGTGAPADIAALGRGGNAGLPPTPPPPPAIPAAEMAPEPGGVGGLGGGMLSNLRVSLMPSDLEGRPAPNLARGLLLLGIVFAAETVIIGIAYFMVSRHISAKVAERDAMLAQITQLDAETLQLETAVKPNAAYFYQLTNAYKSLNEHIYWTQFLSFLERNTLNSVQYVSFSGDASTGVISLDALARSYRDAAEQIVSLRENPDVLSVQSTSASADVDDLGTVRGVSFAMSVRVKPELWHKFIVAAAGTPAAPAANVPTTPPATTTEPAPIPTPTPEPTQPEPEVVQPPTEPVTPPATGTETPTPDATAPAAETPPASETPATP